jgi:hypothetical protein
VSLWLCVPGLQVQLARGTSSGELIANLEAAIQDGSPLTVRLMYGGRLVLNGGRLHFAAVVDDSRKRIPVTVADLSSMISSNISGFGESRLDSLSTAEPQTATEPPPP